MILCQSGCIRSERHHGHSFYNLRNLAVASFFLYLCDRKKRRVECKPFASRHASHVWQTCQFFRASQQESSLWICKRERKGGMEWVAKRTKGLHSELNEPCCIWHAVAGYRDMTCTASKNDKCNTTCRHECTHKEKCCCIMRCASVTGEGEKEGEGRVRNAKLKNSWWNVRTTTKRAQNLLLARKMLRQWEGTCRAWCKDGGGGLYVLQRWMLFLWY